MFISALFVNPGVQAQSIAPKLETALCESGQRDAATRIMYQ